MNSLFTKRRALSLMLIFLLFSFPDDIQAQHRVLHYTQTTGWDHGTADVSRQMFEQLGSAHNFTVDHDPSGQSFNSLATLQQYDLIVWSNTSGSYNLSQGQRTNFEAYIAQGGSYLGIHAASDTYRHSSANGGGTGQWDFYAEEVCGGSVQQNPNHTAQNFPATMTHVGSHASLENVPNPWNKNEEYYYWEGGYLSPDITEVLRVGSTGGQSYDQPRPISWYMNLDGGGRSFYTAMGHDHSNFTSDDNFRNHIRDALLWILEDSDNGGGGTPPNGQVALTGELKKWHRVTLTFDGPQTSEADGNNPFLNYRLDVTFTNGARTYVVPGFFAANGNAAETGSSSGNKWRVHFTPDAEGSWTYRASFRTGTNVAVADNPQAGSPTSFDGTSGSFNVGPTDKSGIDHRGKGMLRYVGKHHLQFAETGEYYLKGGADSPENFLGYLEFDGTQDHGGLDAPGLPNGLHTYSPHIGDWRAGDPSWKNGKGKGIIGAINYLASVGGNSIYFLTYNTDGGDGRDSYMWTSPGARTRYDCSKLDQWEIVFSHMDAKGMQLHVVTQETENNTAMGGLSTERKLYYRELVARFAHHLALQWNIGEENSNSDNDKRAFANHLKRLDPYDHPIAVHTRYDEASTYYNNLFGDPGYDATSIQGTVDRYNEWAIELRSKSANAGRPWAIYGDEQAPAVSPNNGNLDRMRKGLWGNLMGGGAGVEWYFGYQNTFGDVQSEDWRIVEPLWRQTKYALDFFQQYLPFHDMTPDNGLASNGMALAKPGEVYAIYLENGGSTNLNLNGQAGTFPVAWYNPRTGGELITGNVTSVNGGGTVSLGNAPGGGDWVVIVGEAANTSGGGECEADFVESNGMLVMEAESANLGNGWTEHTDNLGQTGTSYLEWTGGDAFNNPGNGTTTYTFEIKTPGTYRFLWRSRIVMGAENTEHNDAWLRFPDADDFYGQQGTSIVYPHGSGKSPTPEGSGADGWFKIYMNVLDTWSWITQTSDNDAHFIYARFDSPGVYTLELSGRSNGYAIDRMVLFNDQVTEAQATNTGLSETRCGDPTEPGNTPPSFSLSDDVTVVENFVGTETVTVSPGFIPLDEQDQVVTYRLSPATVPFANVSIDPQTGTVSITAVPNQHGSQTFVVTADDGQAENNTFSQSFTLTVLSEEAANAVIRINTGGPAYTATGGLPFEADVHFSGGRPFEVENAISGTVDDVIYQSERTAIGSLSYNIPVPVGNYLVRLHFAEIYHNQNGARVFSIELEGNEVLADYDIVASAGPFAADVKEFPVTVAGGTLDITLVASVDQPKISGIEILRNEPEIPNTPPSFTLSGDITVDEDFTSTEVVTVSPNDVPDDEQDQEVTYRLSPAAVAFAEVAIDSITGEVSISALPDGFGSQVFQLIADDGMPNDNLATETFTLTVSPVNDAPTFVVSGDVEVEEDFSEPQVVSVATGPVPENEQAQVVSYHLEPATVDFVEVSLDSLSGDVTFTAVEHAHGSQQFILTADDGEAANATHVDTFRLTVTPVNDVPTFSLSTSRLSLLENFEGVEMVEVIPAPVPEDEQDETVVYSLSPETVPFASISFDPVTGEVAVEAVEGETGEQLFTITASDGTEEVSRTFFLRVSTEPEIGYDTYINAGGGAYASTGGIEFVPDTYFEGGNVAATTDSIAETTDDPLYQALRAGEAFGYAIPLYFGNYTIRLHFADIDTSAQINRFNVELEGRRVLSDFEVQQATGEATATVRMFNMTITDGMLNIDLTATEGVAQLAAIEIELTATPPNSPPFFSLSGDLRVEENFEGTVGVQVAPHPVPPAEQNQVVTYHLEPRLITFADVSFDSLTGEVRFTSLLGETGSQLFTITADDGQEVNNQVSESFLFEVYPMTPDSLPDPEGLVYINAGGPSYLASTGNSFSADVYYDGGNILQGATSVSGTDDPTLFETSRSSEEGFSYHIPLYFGNYTVQLFFADYQSSAAGQRVFDVEMEGNPVLTGLDIFDEAGAQAALVKTLNLTVTDGTLDLAFLARTGAPTVSAIAIELTATPENRPPFFSLSGDVSVEENFSETQYVSVSPLPVHPDEANQVVTYSLAPASVDFAQVAINPNTGLVTINALPNAHGSQRFYLTADDGQEVNNRVTESFMLTVSPGSGGGGTPLTALRINAGSSQSLVFGGHTFVADVHYSNNYSWENESSPAIANTPYDALYHTERAAGTDLGSFSYDIPVVDGDYKVFLHFAEIYWGASGGSSTGGTGTRVFNVDIEGVPSLVNYDIIEEVGSMAADVEAFEVTVTDGTLNLDFYAVANRPKVAAIEVLPADEANTSISSGIGNHFTAFDPSFSPQEDESSDKLIVFPNPAGADASVMLETKLTGTFELMIYDSWGRLYQHRVIEKRDRFQEYPLSLEELPAGLYAIQVVQNGYSIATKLWRTGQ